MLVETYEAIEQTSDGIECDADAIALIEQLDLDGQRKLLRKNADGETTRCPYRKMTSEEGFVYSVLCPNETKLNSYSDGPIPLRVLQVAAHAGEFFEELAVLYPSNADIKDPVLIGKKKERGPYGMESHTYILARWGEVLEDLAVLRNKAVEVGRKLRSDNLRRILAEVQSHLAIVDSLGMDGLSGKLAPSYYG